VKVGGGLFRVAKRCLLSTSVAALRKGRTQREYSTGRRTSNVTYLRNPSFRRNGDRESHTNKPRHWRDEREQLKRDGEKQRERERERVAVVEERRSIDDDNDDDGDA